MTLRSLEIFVAVVKFGKMSEASKQLHISQPTISQAINELETEYNIMLFNRLSKKLYITEAGKKLYAYANNMLCLRDEMEKNMINLSTNKIITLGATMTVGKCVLIDIIKEFEESHPNIKVNVIIDNTVTIEKLLLNGELDLALIEGTIRSNELLSNPIIPDSLVLACHPSHILTKNESVHISELSKYPFVLREEGSGTREVFENELKKHNVCINIKWNCHGSDSIVEAVLANQGITVISKRLIESYVKDNKLNIIDIDNVSMDRNFSLVYHKTKFISSHLNAFISYIS